MFFLLPKKQGHLSWMLWGTTSNKHLVPSVESPPAFGVKLSERQDEGGRGRKERKEKKEKPCAQ